MDETWRLIDSWIERAMRAGQRFGSGDLLIGALAQGIGALVWSLDADFVRMGRIGMIGLYEPPRAAPRSKSRPASETIRPT